MKNKLVLLFAIAAFSLNSIAQEVEKKFTPYYLKEGKAESFEKVAATVEAKAIGLGYGGVNTYYTVFEGRNSPVRFSAGSIPKFVLEIEENTETFELVILVKADVTKKSKKYRKFVQGGSSMGGTKDMSEHYYMPELKKIEGNLYEMSFKQPLPPGEYSFKPIIASGQNYVTSSGKVLIYCFGVDE